MTQGRLENFDGIGSRHFETLLGSYFNYTDKAKLATHELSNLVASIAASLLILEPKTPAHYVTGSGIMLIGGRFPIPYDLISFIDSLKTKERAFFFTTAYLGGVHDFPQFGPQDFEKISLQILGSRAFRKFSIIDGWQCSSVCEAEYSLAKTLGINIDLIMPHPRKPTITIL